jgi:hypothetical protein
MKNILFVAALIAISSAVTAQQFNDLLLKKEFNLCSYYSSAEKIREEVKGGGGQSDFQAMREKMQPFMDERDKKLQGILTEDQFKTWKEQIEPSLRSRRQGGNGNR